MRERGNKVKVILTSKGFENKLVFNKIMNIINIDIRKIRMLVIPTARKNEYKKEKYMKDYIELGFKEENIIFFDDKKANQFSKLNIDIIYVCGGNTFVLKHYLKKSGFEKSIYEYLRNGVIYIGASAGSQIATNNIEHILKFDENVINEKDMSGLNLYDGILVCHYGTDREDIYRELLKENKKVETLSDDELLYLKNGIWIKK